MPPVYLKYMYTEGIVFYEIVRKPKFGESQHLITI